MIEKYGNIWDRLGKPNEWVGVTTNNAQCSYGLVMGAGIAKEAANRFPDLPKRMGTYIGVDYLLVLFRNYGIFCFQTKRDWRDPSPLDLVERSIERLSEIAARDETSIFNLTRPGCGLGGLNWETQVKPICETYLKGDNFIVWHK